ncbi:hypothetical protein GF312_03235 [Candidatus Poribacteria bacterium]|nr:hypothetical protein [Candidatus Poribacteria bacterium]
MGGSYYSSQKKMDEKVRQIQDYVRQIEQREQRKFENATMPADLWVESGLREGGILIIHPNERIRRRLIRSLERQRHQVTAVDHDERALRLLRKFNYNAIILQWGIFRRSSDLVSLLRKAFPNTKIIITSPKFAWLSESSEGAELGLDALQAGAYSYIPNKYIERNAATCLETALSSPEKACPVLLTGRSCQFQCIR